MDYKDIKKLMDDMGESKLHEIEIEFPDGTKIKIKKDKEDKLTKEANINMPIVMPSTLPATKEKGELKPVEEYKCVKAPMVGTFYSKPNPDAKAYVEVGSKVKKGDKLCIIEAMKLMNEIESDYNGEIVEILVNDAEPVEYGKVLFKIKESKC